MFAGVVVVPLPLRYFLFIIGDPLQNTPQHRGRDEPSKHHGEGRDKEDDPSPGRD